MKQNQTTINKINIRNILEKMVGSPTLWKVIFVVSSPIGRPLQTHEIIPTFELGISRKEDSES